jgi:hypothetical protein
MNVEKAFMQTTEIILNNIENNEFDLTNEVSTLYFLTFIEYRNQARKCWTCGQWRQASGQRIEFQPGQPEGTLGQGRDQKRVLGS